MLNDIIAYLGERPLETINLIMSFFGFILIGYETYKVRGVAEAAKEAAKNALKEITVKVSIGDLNSMAINLQHIQELLRSNNYQVALDRCQHVRPELHSLRRREGFSSQDKKEQIQEMITGIRRLQDNLEKLIDNPTLKLDAPKTNKRLSDFANTLYEWGEEIKFATGDKNDS